MYAIQCKEVLTITNGVIKNGTILVDEGKIKAVGENIEIPGDAEIIRTDHETVMPGFVEAHCHIGIMEEKVGWAGADINERSEVATPQARVIDAIKANADEFGLECALVSGVTTAQILPGSSNVIGGTGSIIKTAPKKTIDEMLLVETSGMKVAFGENPMRCFGIDKSSMPLTRMGVAAVLREWLQKTRNYLEKQKRFEKEPDKQPEFDSKLEALIPVLNREIPMRVHAHRADDAVTAHRICREFDIDMTWEHATEGHRLCDWLVENNLPTVWGPGFVHLAKWEMREMSFKTPGILHKAGVQMAIQTDAPGRDISFLPLSAGLAVKYGLPYQAGLEAITISPARILGIDDRVGSIEPGKDADLIFVSGDPLEISSHVNRVMINGQTEYLREKE